MFCASFSKGRKKERKFLQSKCKSCKFAATPVPNKTGKSYFHTGNLTQHLKCKHPEQHETLIESKRRSSFAASSSAFITVMRPTEKCHVDYTINVSDFKKAVVEAVTLNGLPRSVFEESGTKKILQPIINKSGVCLNRRGVRSMVINQAESFRTALANRLKNKLVSIKFDTASRKERGFWELTSNVGCKGDVNSSHCERLKRVHTTGDYTAKIVTKCAIFFSIHFVN